MKTFRNLRLSARLGVAFGALAGGLLVVAATATVVMGGLSSDIERIRDHDLKVANLLGSMGERSEMAGHLTAQHLYVFDGDLPRQDAVARLIEQLKAANERDFAATGDLLAGSPSEEAFARYQQAEGRYIAAIDEAVKRSRAETAQAVEERAGSRRVYSERVVVLSTDVEESAARVDEAEDQLADEQVAAAVGHASSGRDVIGLVALVALAIAAALAVAVTRSVTR
ncbi:MAG: hypothetical protein ACRDK0_03790, partial [Solirubrobacteraceae bacterium]